MTTVNPLPPSQESPPPTLTQGVTALMQACQQGKETLLRQLLHKDATTARYRDRTGKTALHYCAENSSLSCIDQLLHADPSLLSARDEDGYTALHLATIAGNRAVVKFLLAKGADIHAIDNEKHTAVHWATVCGEVELLDLLIDAGANPSTPDIHGAYPIHYAAQMCGPNSELGTEVHVGLQVLQKLLQRGVDVTVRDHDGRQPLLWASSAEVRPSHVYCPSGSADAILALVNAGADVAAEDKDGLTALHCASSRGHLDCQDVLVNLCSAEVDTMDSNGCTPLFYAATLGHADCTEMLLKHGAIADRQDRKGRTPAHCGAAKGQLETLKLLHRHGADMWKRNIKGDLPLHEACQSGRKDLVLWLLSLQPEAVNSPNNDGRCPLHIAAITNNIEMCKVLMDSKATVNPIMRNSRGQLLTPVDAAVARGNKGCAKYLQLHGGLPASKLTDKRALQLAMQKALEAGPVIGSTGATPSDSTPGEATNSSSPVLIKTPSTTVLSPTLLSPSDALLNQVGQNTQNQTSVALQMGSSSFSPHSVDSESQTETSPQLQDAETYTSEENIRNSLVEEEKKINETITSEEQQNEEVSTNVISETTKSDEVSTNEKMESTETADGSSEQGEGTESTEEKSTSQADEETNLEISESSVDNTLGTVEDEEEGKLLDGEAAKDKDTEKSEHTENGVETNENENVESNESRSTESSSESSQDTVKSRDNYSTEVETAKTVTVATHETISEVKNVKAKQGTEQKKKDKVKNEAKTKELVKQTSSKNVKAEKQKANAIKKAASVENDEGKTEGKTIKKKTLSKQENTTNGSKTDTKVSKKVSKTDIAKHQDGKQNKDGNDSTKKNSKTKVNKRTRSEEHSGRKPEKKGEAKIRSSSLENTVHKESKSKKESSTFQKSESRRTNENNSKKITKLEEQNLVEDRGSAEESENSEEGEDQDHISSEGSRVSGDKTISDKAKGMNKKNKLSVPERELGDGASEDGEGLALSGNESDSKSSSSKKKKIFRRKSSKSKQSKIIEESDADRSANESGSSLYSSEEENGEENNKEERPKSVKRLSRPRTAIRRTSSSRSNKKDLLVMAENASMYSGDERTHEMLLLSSARDVGLVREAPTDSIYSPSRLSLQDNQSFKKVNGIIGSNKSFQERSSSYSYSDEENDSGSKSKRKVKKAKNRSSNESESNNQSDRNTIVQNGEIHSDSSRGLTEGNLRYEQHHSVHQKSEHRISNQTRRGSVDRGSEDEEMSQSASDGDVEGNDARKKEMRIARTKRRKMKLMRRTEMKITKEAQRPKDKKEVGKRAMSGGPRKVENLDLNLRKKSSPVTEVSITRAMQGTMRKYALERRLFQQLLDLKRMQIRNSRANEHVMIKRLVDEYNKEGALLGLKDYRGPYNFQTYEKYLYDQLRMLQSSQGTRIPKFKANDDVEKLTRALRKANVPDLTQTLDDRDRNPKDCNHTTHRCHHAIHAYTGVPCAAYLTQYNRNMKAGKVNLPRLPPPPHLRGEPNKAKDLRTYDPGKPLKVELQHGNAKQQISLPTNFLDKSQKYQLTVSIQPSNKGNKRRQELNITTETENLTKENNDSKPSSAHSAPDAPLDTLVQTSKEIRSFSTDGHQSIPQTGKLPPSPPPVDK